MNVQKLIVNHQFMLLGFMFTPVYTHVYIYRVTAINVSRKWIEWAEWAASLCTANSPFPGPIYCRHLVLFGRWVEGRDKMDLFTTG